MAYTFNITLTAEERMMIIRGIWAQEFKINSDIADLSAIDSVWAKDDIAKLERKRNELRALAIRIEG